MKREFTMLIMAAGFGMRAGGGIPKQYQEIGGLPILRHTINAALKCKSLKSLHVVIQPEHMELYENATKGLGLPAPIMGGKNTRQESVFNGLVALSHLKDKDKILIHDAARVFITPQQIESIAKALDKYNAVTLCNPMKDSIRNANRAMDRSGVFSTQTPQGFRYGEILNAHKKSKDINFSDDASLLESCGHKIHMVQGSAHNTKITTKEDLQMAAQLLSETRSALGFDAHKLGSKKPLILCGVEIPHHQGLIGHSDADAPLHALTDAILSLCSKGDIGQYFPPSDDKYKDAKSEIFVKKALEFLSKSGGRLTFIDITIICERPKISPHRDAMRASLSQITGLDIKRISVKATTTEGLGFTGKGQGIAAQALANAIFYAPYDM